VQFGVNINWNAERALTTEKLYLAITPYFDYYLK
jgi:hypothetical protein